MGTVSCQRLPATLSSARQGGQSSAPPQPALHAAARQERALLHSLCKTLTLLALASTQEPATPLPANLRGWRKLIKGKTQPLWVQSKAGRAMPGTQQPVWMQSCQPHPGRCRQGGLHHCPQKQQQLFHFIPNQQPCPPPPCKGRQPFAVRAGSRHCRSQLELCKGTRPWRAGTVPRYDSRRLHERAFAAFVHKHEFSLSVASHSPAKLLSAP